MKFLANAIEILVWALMIGFLVLRGIGLISDSKWQSEWRMFVVQSGSMEPSIMTGDVVVTKAYTDYTKNDVITFASKTLGIVTHRVVKHENNIFVTKGDANRVIDNDQTSNAQIIGKVVLVVPMLGKLIVFGRSPIGLFFMIGIPACVIIAEEIYWFGSKRKRYAK
ncbi:MAG: signal peptidase I [bacterium]